MPNLTVTVRNKDRILYSGSAYAVSSVNDRGIFDILPQHENFITLLKEKVTIHQTQKESKDLQINNGVLKVSNNKVNIYVNFES